MTDAGRQADVLQNAIFNSANFSSIATDAKGVIQIFNVGAELSLDRSQGGLGIRLALVQRLTVLHGGRVEAQSVIGKGSEFALHWPVIPPLVADSVRGSPLSGVVGRPIRVLIVDDQPDTVLSLSLWMKASGHDARAA